MTIKRFTLILALLSLLPAGVFAHDDAKPEGFAVVGFWHSGPAAMLGNSIVLEATGLESDELRAALQEGSTLRELIEANGGDAASVSADLLARATEASESAMQARLEGLSDEVAEALNASHASRDFWGRRGLRMPRILMHSGAGAIILEATGLDVAGLRSALADGATIAELVDANDADLATLTADLTASITEAMQSASSEALARFEERVSEMLDTDFTTDGRRRWSRRPGKHGMFGFWSIRGSQTTTAEAAG